jgi:hypothetical protein
MFVYIHAGKLGRGRKRGVSGLGGVEGEKLNVSRFALIEHHFRLR